MSASPKYCLNCGKPVSVDVRFCPSCGATIAGPTPPTAPSYAAPPSYPTYQPPYQPAPRKSNTTLIIAIVVIVVVVVGVLGAIAALSFFNTVSTVTTWHSANIVNGLVTVQAGYYEYYPITIQSGVIQAIVNGTFTASGGTGNDIKVYVMDNTNFVNWQNGHTASTYYNSGQVTTGNISATLSGPGTYYLVYDNTFSTTAAKNVQTTANLYYQG